MVLAHARTGKDPASERKRIRSAPRYIDFLDEFWEKWATRWSAKTCDINCGYRRLYLQDTFSSLCINELNEEHVTKWFAHVNRPTGPGAANMAFGLLRLMLNKAEDWGYRLENTNPCRVIRPNRNRPCERFLTTEELRSIGKVLAKEGTSDNAMRSLTAKAATLFILNGCRRGEILGLHWKDIRGNRIKLRHGKSGPRMVWLGDDARAVIETIPSHDKIPWGFLEHSLPPPYDDDRHTWAKVSRGTGLPGLRVHDLRHTFASHAAMNKETLPMIGRLLGRANAGSTARYAHFDDDHVLEAAEQIGSTIEKMLS